MSDIVELLERFREGVVEPPLAPSATARIAIEREAARALVKRPRLRRRVVAGLGALATAGLGGIVAVLFVASPKQSAPSGAARVDWGLTEQLRVEPVAGVGRDDAVARSIEALKSRAVTNDIAGMTVERTGGDVITVSVPGTDDRNDLIPLSTFPVVDVFNLSTTRIAGGSVADVAAAASALPGRPVRWAVAGKDPRDAFVQIVGSRAEADRQARLRHLANPIIFALPPGVILVDLPSANLPEVALMRDEPFLTARDLDTVSFEDRRMVVALRHDRLESASRVVGRELGRARAARFAVVSRSDPERGYQFAASTRIVRTSTGFALGGLPSDSDDQAAFALGGEPVVPAKLTLESFGPYGTAPPPPGERVVLPKPLQDEGIRAYVDGSEQSVDRESIVRVISAAKVGSDWTIYAGRTVGGRQAAWLGPPDGNRDGVVPLQCSPGAGVPIMKMCPGMALGRHGIDDGVFVGRVREEVASVSVRNERTGEVRQGIVENGWFMIPYRERATRRLTLREFTARDADGNVVAVIDSAGRLRRR